MNRFIYDSRKLETTQQYDNGICDFKKLWCVYIIEYNLAIRNNILVNKMIYGHANDNIVKNKQPLNNTAKLCSRKVLIVTHVSNIWVSISMNTH